MYRMSMPRDNPVSLPFCGGKRECNNLNGEALNKFNCTPLKKTGFFGDVDKSNAGNAYN
jgi:hypothetical protein